MKDKLLFLLWFSRITESTWRCWDAHLLLPWAKLLVGCPELCRGTVAGWGLFNLPGAPSWHFLTREGGDCSLQQGRKCSYALTANSRTLRTQLRSRVSCSTLHSNGMSLRPCEPGLANSQEWNANQGHRGGKKQTGLTASHWQMCMHTSH